VPARKASGQQVFDAYRAEAQASWIQAVGTAYVTHAGQIAYAQEHFRPYLLAQTPPPVRQDASTTPGWVQTENSREYATALHQDSYANTMARVESVRRSEHAFSAGRLAVAQATADKQRGIDLASADKRRAVAQAQQASSDVGSGLDWPYDAPGRQHAQDVAKAALEHTLRVEDAKLRFHRAEIHSRRAFSQAQASLQRTRDTNLATAARRAARPARSWR